MSINIESVKVSEEKIGLITTKKDGETVISVSIEFTIKVDCNKQIDLLAQLLRPLTDDGPASIVMNALDRVALIKEAEKKTSIKVLKFTQRTKNILKSEDINYIEDLIERLKDLRSLRKIPNVGTKTVCELTDVLKEGGYI